MKERVAFLFTVPGPVVSKARTRAIGAGIRGRYRKGMRLTDEVRGYQDRIASEALKAGIRRYSHELATGPIAVSWIAIFKAPRRPAPSGAVGQKDRDNIDKIVLDGLKEFFNDNRVSSGLTLKAHGEIEALHVAIAWGGDDVIENAIEAFCAIHEISGLDAKQAVSREIVLQ